jgi:hypothetical protein
MKKVCTQRLEIFYVAKLRGAWIIGIMPIERLEPRSVDV